MQNILMDIITKRKSIVEKIHTRYWKQEVEISSLRGKTYVHTKSDVKSID